MFRLCELLCQQLGAVGFSVDLNDAAICLMGKQQLVDAGTDQCIA